MEASEKQNNATSGLNLKFDGKLLMYMIRKSFVWSLTFILLCLVTAFLIIRYSTPMYQSTAVIQVSNENNANYVLTTQDDISQRELSVDIELLRSDLLIKQAVNDLDINVRYFTEGEILTEENYKRAEFNVEEAKLLDSTLCGTPIYVTLDNGKIELKYKKAEKSFSCAAYPGEACETEHFKVQLVISNEKGLVNRLAGNKVYFSFTNPDNFAATIKSDLIVEVLNADARTIKISAKNSNPILARDISMAIAEEFISFDTTQNVQGYRNVINFLDEQLGVVSDSLDASEEKLEKFKQANRVKKMDQVSTNYLDRTSDMETKLMQIDIDLQILKEIKGELDKDNQVDAYQLMPLLVGTKFESTLSDHLKTLEQLLLEKEELKLSVQDKSPQLRNINYKIEVQSKLIKEGINSILTQLERNKKTLQTKLKEYEDGFLNMPRKEIELARLTRKHEINVKFHSMLLEKMTEYSISREGYTSNTRILEKAQASTTPLSPNKTLIYAAFIILGLFLSGGMVVLRYVFYSYIDSKDDIDANTDVSISFLGNIPKYPHDIPVSQLLIDKNPKSILSESFRTLRTNLQFIDNSPGPKTAAVTSTISGEGKTFVSINLAGIWAFSGKKVIIADLDMRKPKIHKGFGVDNERGMSSLLIQSESLKDCIRHSELEGLDFITAGPVPPNPAELIINGQLNVLVEELKKDYDLIVFDNPPIGIVTDGLPIFKEVDFPIFVLRAGYSRRPFARNIDQLVTENGIRKLSVVLNSVDFTRSPYGRSYGIGYGYGYGYGYNNYYSDEIVKKSWIKRILKR